MLRDWSTLYHCCLQATLSSGTMVRNHLMNSLWLSLYIMESISTNDLIDINRLLLPSTWVIRPPSKSKSVNRMTKLLSQIFWINHFCENAKKNKRIQSMRAESNDNNNFFNWKNRKILHFFMEARAILFYRLSFGEFVKYSILQLNSEHRIMNTIVSWSLEKIRSFVYSPMNIIHINFFFVYHSNVSVHRTVCTANTENRLKINWTDFYFETVSALNPNEPRKKADNPETYLQWLFSVRCANKTPTKFIIYHEKCS